MDKEYKFKVVPGSKFDWDDEHIESTITKLKIPVTVQFPDMQRGNPSKTSPENMAYLLENVLKYSIRYNELLRSAEINGENYTDDDLAAIRNACRTHQLSADTTYIEDGIKMVAKNNVYHPFKAEVERVDWDGVDRIDALCKTISIDKSNEESVELYKKYLRKWLIGVIAKVYSPGTQNMILVLQGDQGVGKSRWTAKLGLVESTYGEGHVNPEDKDHTLRHLTKVVWNISELDSVTSKRDVSALKDYITKSEVSVRGAYQRKNTEGKSVLSFVASVNNDEFLRDITGNRRFLVIPVIGLDVEHQIDMQQVYAQALSLHINGERYWFDRDENKAINEENDKFMTKDGLDTLVLGVMEGEDEVLLDDILIGLNYAKSSRDITNGERVKCGALLKKCGISSKRVRINGGKVRVYLVSKTQIQAKNGLWGYVSDEEATKNGGAK